MKQASSEQLYNRRHGEEDRLKHFEKIIDSVQVDIGKIKEKIFNGFSDSIKSTENKVNYIDDRNREEHKMLIDSIKELAHNSEQRNSQLSKKFDKMLYLWLSGSLTIVIGVFVFILKEFI